MICHALKCSDVALARRCLCAKHWLALPEALRTRIDDEIKAAGEPKPISGQFATSVTLAIRWLAVSEKILGGPCPVCGRLEAQCSCQPERGGVS